MKGTESEWKIGQRVAVFIEDVGDNVQRKDGEIAGDNSTHLIIKNLQGERHAILKARILRVEFK